MLGSRVLGRLMLVALLVPTLAAGISDPDDFCTGDPCVITADATVDDGAVVDFGARDVVVRAKLTIADGRATFRAGSFTIEPNGTIDANGPGAMDDGGSVTIETVGDVVVDGAIRANGLYGGDITIGSSAGSIRGAAPMSTKSTEDGGGGNIDFDAQGEITLTGDIDARRLGSIFFVTEGDVTATGLLDVDGEGTVDVTTEGAVTLGPVRANSSEGEYGSPQGGWLFIDAYGDVTLAGFEARGRAGYYCGDGGVLLVSTLGDLIINGEVDLSTGGGYCAGGTFRVDDAASVTTST